MFSITTHPDAKLITPGNGRRPDSLAELHQIAWVNQDTDRVFQQVPVERETGERRIEDAIPDFVTKLSWTVGGTNPIFLSFEVELNSILVRKEYRETLFELMRIIKYGGGENVGYTLSELTRMESATPHNPFKGFVLNGEKTLNIKAVSVLGSPGIGKSMFLIYVLALRLLARQPTVLQWFRKEFLYFCDEGVYSVPCPNYAEGDEFLSIIPEGTWFLVDSNKDLIEPPNIFLKLCRQGARFLVHAASPERSRVDWRYELNSSTTAWMAPWTLAELISARHFQTKAKASEKQLKSFFERYGPIAFDAYTFAIHQDLYSLALRDAVMTLTTDVLTTAVTNASFGPFSTGIAHNILVVNPNPCDRKDYCVELASLEVQKLLLERLLQLDDHKRFNLYRLFVNSHASMRLSRKIFEAAVIQLFLKGGQWRMVKMRRCMEQERITVFWKKNDGRKLYLNVGHAGRSVAIGFCRLHDDEEFYPVHGEYYIALDSEPLILTDRFYIPFTSNIGSLSFTYSVDANLAVIFHMTIARIVTIKCKCLRWIFRQLDMVECNTVDLVVVCDGGSSGCQISIDRECADKIRHVYRMDSRLFWRGDRSLSSIDCV